MGPWTRRDSFLEFDSSLESQGMFPRGGTCEMAESVEDRNSRLKGKGVLGELCGEMLFVYLLMSLLCRCPSP